MTATIDASAAVIKLRYPNGRLPKSTYQRNKAKITSLIERREDWKGGDWVVALQNENPQGSSVDVPTAQGSLAQGVYNKFTVTRQSHYGIARIKGEALLAVEGNEGALVDLWMNEMQGITATEVINTEIYAFGNGAAMLGQIASGNTGLTVTLGTLTDIAKFALNMRVQCYAAADLTGSPLGGIATITAIDRVNGTLTIGASTWAAVAGAGSTSYICRAGDGPSSSTGRVLTGFLGWIVGGTTPGTLFGLSRNSDPTRLAGNIFDSTGVPREEAIIEGSARVNTQGAPQPTVGFCHPRDLGDFKKALGAKVTYPKATVPSKVAGVSFSGIEVEGDEDRINLMSSPFMARNRLFLMDPDSWMLRSLKASPHLQDYDTEKFLRVGSDDAYEVRFASFHNMACDMPFANIDIQNWGA